VSHSKEHLERVTAELQTALGKNAQLESKVADLSNKLATSLVVEQNTKRQLEGEQNARLKEEDIRKVSTEQADTHIDALRKELDVTKVRYVKYVEAAEAKAKEAFQTQVSLKMQLARVEADAETEVEAARADAKCNLERAVTAEQKTKVTMQELSKAKARNLDEQKAQHEMIALLRTEVETAKVTIAQKDAMISTNTKEAFQRNIDLQAQIERLQEDLLQQRNSFTAAEKQHQTEVSKKSAEISALQAEMTRLSEELIATQKKHMEATVTARVDGETLRTKIHGLETDLDHFKNKYREMEVKLKSENEGLRKSGRDEHREHDAEAATLRDNLARTSGELRMSSRRLSELEQALQEREKHFATMSEAHAKETATLKAEVTGYRQSVRQLESHIAENINFKIAQEKCESLEAELVSARNQVLHLNHVVSDMRVESEIVEQYRVKILQERYDDLLKETDSLRSQAKFCLPLLDECLTALHRVDTLGVASGGTKMSAAMRKEIELYQREYAAVPSAVSAYSVT